MEVVPPRLVTGSRGRWVTTKTGMPNGGSSPHGSSPKSNRPAQQQRPGAAGELAEDVGVGVARLAAFAEVSHPGHPLVQPFAAVAHGLSGTGVGSGDEAVERHGEAQVDLSHRFSSSGSWTGC